MSLLAGKYAIVTGGASGIGRATARRMLEEGASVALLDRDREGVEETARELGALGLAVDVADSDALEKAVCEAAAQLGGLSIVFNNAGAGQLAPLEQYSAQDFERLVRVNLIGVFNGIRAAAPLLRENGGGAIVNNASESGVRPTTGEAPYSAAKAGVIALTMSAALELSPEIRVNCVSPGIIRTPMTEELYARPETLEPVERAIPLQRTGTAGEVAEVVLFLATDRASFVTGQNLIVDGGLGLPQAGIDPVLQNMVARMRGA